ncbi:lantibiotic dehydratase [Streptomyces sp. 12297]
MAPKAPLRYRWQGTALLRAGTLDSSDDLLDGLDLEDFGSIRRWLEAVWGQRRVRDVVGGVSPVLAEAVAKAAADDWEDERELRRTASALAVYLLRWQHRPTPLGGFAGTTAVRAGRGLRLSWGTEHQVRVRADAEWVADTILQLQSHREVLALLPVAANNTAIVRGARIVAPGVPADGHARLMPPVELSVSCTRPAAAALRAAREPLTYAALHNHLREGFPRASAQQVDDLLRELIAHHLLITSLWAPMTETDALGHVCTELEKAGAHGLADGDALQLVKSLTGVHEELSGVTLLPGLDAPVRQRMLSLSQVTPTPLVVDTALDCFLQIPRTVVDEVQKGVAVLSRVTPYPYGHPHWVDYHRRFRDRYGVGAVVPVMELVSGSGLGLPAGYLGAEERGPRVLTDRDKLVMALVQEAALEGRHEVVLDDRMVERLAAAAGTDEAFFVPQVEAAFEVHASTADGMAGGQFRAVITGVPRPGSSMAGRFVHLLAPHEAGRLAATYQGDPDTLTPQLSFPPRRRRSENVIRTPQLLPQVISLAEHPGPDSARLPLRDIAVTADARHLYLVHRITGQPITPRVLHALEAATQTPPLARFLAEVATSRYAAYRPFDFGAAAHLPFLPAIVYGRTVLSPARWRMKATDFPGRTASMDDWDDALLHWCKRLNVPLEVSLVEHDQRLPLDLVKGVHHHLLRTQLDRARHVELQAGPAADAHDWIGRGHELWMSFERTLPEPGPAGPRWVQGVPRAAADRQMPGAGELLHARLYANPHCQPEILDEHLPALLAALGNPTVWWFTRHRRPGSPDGAHHIALHVQVGPDSHAAAAEHVHDWGVRLHQAGLASHLTLADYQPQTGRFGHGTAMSAAHRVFAADSAAALTQIRLAHRSPAFAPSALAAASALDLITHLAPAPEDGYDWLIQHIPYGGSPLDRTVRDQVHHLTGAGGPAALAALPEGLALTAAWQTRAVALRTYADILTNPLHDCARSLLYLHHTRALGIDPAAEKLTLRLARAAAQRRTLGPAR